MRPGLALLPAAALLLLAASAQAWTQDPATYPDGVTHVGHTPIAANEDFDVAVHAADAQAVTVTVCRFSSLGAPSPDICYMNLQAKQEEAAWTAHTGAVEHPAWKDGWVIGYKATVKTAAGELHAPDRLSAGEPDYYRLVVGEPEVEGSAVVEDTPAGARAEAAGNAPSARSSPGCGPLCALLLVALAALLRRT